MSTTDTTPELPGQIETWRYMGRREGQSGTVYGSWQVPDRPRALLFKGAGYVIGAWYDVRVTRSPEGVTMHGTPEYARTDHSDPCAEWEMADKQVQVKAHRRTLERNAKRRGAVDEALAPLLELAAVMSSSYAAQEALVGYVRHQLHQAFAGRTS